MSDACYLYLIVANVSSVYVVLFTFCLNVYRVEYENLYTWGHEEALSQMNEMSMREEELEYLWVKYNDQRNGIPTEYD